MYKGVPVVIVAALEETTRAIGRHNELIWHIPADLKRFKELSLGHPVVMGRTTFESIYGMLGKPLPGRTNIVITRNSDYVPPEATVRVVHSLEDGLALAAEESPSEIHIGGGAQLYAESLPYVDRLHLTLIKDPSAGADTFFPPYENEFAVVTESEPVLYNTISYRFVDLERITA